MADQQVLDDFFAKAKAALDLPAATYEDAYQLGGPELADELAALVKTGQKTATTSGFELPPHQWWLSKSFTRFIRLFKRGDEHES